VNSIAAKGDFDPRPNDEPRVERKDETVPLQIGKSGQNTRISANMEGGENERSRIC